MVNGIAWYSQSIGYVRTRANKLQNPRVADRVCVQHIINPSLLTTHPQIFRALRRHHDQHHKPSRKRTLPRACRFLTEEHSTAVLDAPVSVKITELPRNHPLKFRQSATVIAMQDADLTARIYERCEVLVMRTDRRKQTASLPSQLPESLPAPTPGLMNWSLTTTAKVLESEDYCSSIL